MWQVCCRVCVGGCVWYWLVCACAYTLARVCVHTGTCVCVCIHTGLCVRVRTYRLMCACVSACVRRVLMSGVFSPSCSHLPWLPRGGRDERSADHHNDRTRWVTIVTTLSQAEQNNLCDLIIQKWEWPCRWLADFFLSNFELKRNIYFVKKKNESWPYTTYLQMVIRDTLIFC